MIALDAATMDHDNRGDLMRSTTWLRSTARVSVLSVATLIAACGTQATSTSSGNHQGAGASARCAKVGLFLVANADAIQETVRGAEAGLFDTLHLHRSQIAITEDNAEGVSTNIPTIAQSLAASRDQMFIVLGTSATIAMYQLVKDRPIITLGMDDPVGSKVARSLRVPRTNVTGSTDYINPAVQLQQVLKVGPMVRSIGTVYDPSEPNAVEWVNKFGAAARTAGVKFVAETASNPTDIGLAARALVGRVNAIFIGDDANTLAGVAAVASTAQQAHIPLYLNGGGTSMPGVFATLGPNYYQVGWLAGLNAAKVCRGAQPASTPFAVPHTPVWSINTRTMMALHLTVPTEILKHASQ
jgi:putative ABC transport system substrate-binding protein